MNNRKEKKIPKLHEMYPRIEIGCTNTRAHTGYGVVCFVIPSGHKNAKCPECGRRAGRSDHDPR